MKQLAFLLISLILFDSAIGQSNATSASHKKITRPALTLTLPYSVEIAEETIVKKLNEIGYDPQTKGSLFWKKNKIDGYYVFKDVALRNLNGQTVDLYFKVDKKSRKSKDADITMLVGSGEEKFASSESQPQIFESATQFLNGFVTHAASHKLEVDIKGQESAVKAAETKYSRLQEEETSLTKKIKELEEKLKLNRENQATQIKVIEAEKVKLSDLRSKS